MEAITINGTYKAENQSGFPSDLCTKRLIVQTEGDRVKLTAQDDSESFIMINSVLYIISSQSELLITNSQGTLRFNKCTDEPKRILS